MGEVATLIMSIVLYFSIQNFLDDLTKIRRLEARISATISLDWSDGLPLNGLIDAHKICLNYPTLSGCSDVDAQIKDISVALQSCVDDSRSDLCKSVVAVISKHPIALILPPVDPLPLPHSPFYISVPTRTLKSIDGNFRYRLEASSWWWHKWSNTIYLGSLLLIIVISTLFLVRHKQLVDQRKALEIARQRDMEKEQERARLINERIAHEELIRQERVLLDAEILKIEQLAQMELANHKLAQAAVKNVAELAEKQEAKELLMAAFHKKPTNNREEKV